MRHLARETAEEVAVARRRSQDENQGESFADLVGKDVKPVPGQRRVAPARRTPAPSASPADAPVPVEFTLEVVGEEVTGLATGMDPAQLGRVRRGEIDWQRSIDLHRLVAQEARLRVRAELAEAVRNGERCVRIIHGRGRGSESGPVLKQALPGWLAEHPHGKQVLGFCCARDIEGGTGVTLVLLRRRRRSG